MRFGKTLQQSVYPPWKDKYMDYEKLKKMLRENETSPQGRAGGSSWTERDEEEFVDELTNNQLEKVHQHQLDTFNSLRDRTAACESRLQPTAEENKQDDKKQIAEETLKELDNISKEITELKKFSRVNYTGFLKAAKKHDRKRGSKYRVRPLLQVRLSQTPFNSEDYSPLLYRLSTMYAWARQILEGEDPRAQSTSSVRPKDTYTAHKFWVHMDNLLEVKTYILRRLPVLVYNPQSLKVADGSQKDPTLTSIYFDNETFDLYQSKVNNTAEPGSLRLRWTGQLNDRPEIVLEKKVVSDTTGSRDIRVQIKEKYIQPFLKGEYKLEKQIAKLEDRLGAENEQVKSMKANVQEIQDFIKDKQLEPILRASYTRTAFQIPGDDRIRVSLDTDLVFIREDALDTDRPCRDPDTWHRSDIDDQRLEYPYSTIKKGEITRFKHAVLEIKVKDSSANKSAWLEDLMTSHLVKEAPKFSKFVHGVAQLFEDYVNSFPFWLSDLEVDIRRDPQTAFEEEQDKLAQRVEDEIAVGSFLPTSRLSISQQGSSPLHRLREGSLSKTRAMSKSSPARQPQLDVTAEERDSDDDGIQSNGVNVTDSSKKGGLRAFLPAFSNSRYARRHRGGDAWTQDAPLPPTVKDPGVWIKDQGPLKVEGKVWLANQRTFVKWQHVAILLATLSLGLYNAAGIDNTIARALAVVYTAFAVFASVWGWGIYIWRTKLITQRSGKDFDHMLGPFVVAVGLACALILNFAFKYNSEMADRGTRLILSVVGDNDATWRQEL